MRVLVAAVIALFATLPAPLPAFAQQAEDETKVRAVIADWYERVSHFEADMPWVLLAPGSIDGGPGYSVPADLNSGSRVLRGPWLNHELAAKALKFSYDIDVLKVDARLAKAIVWERGYFYAWSAQVTYESGMSTLFILEKQDTGEWKILAHDARSVGIPSNKITNPMPDLRDLYYSRCGAACDPKADAEKAKEF